MCEPQKFTPGTSPDEGITEEMDRILADRSAKNKVQTWEEIWRLLFGPDTTILEPGEPRSGERVLGWGGLLTLPFRIPTHRRSGRSRARIRRQRRRSQTRPLRKATPAASRPCWRCCLFPGPRGPNPARRGATPSQSQPTLSSACRESREEGRDRHRYERHRSGAQAQEHLVAILAQRSCPRVAE